MNSNKQATLPDFTKCFIKTHLLCPLQELMCSLKGLPKQDSVVQTMWLDDSDCTPSTSSSPGKKERKKNRKNPLVMLLETYVMLSYNHFGKSFICHP